MSWKLELVPIPVSDIDRAKRFYHELVGFEVTTDTQVGEMHIVQLTPPGSACSIVLGAGVDMAPGSVKGLHVVVPDVEKARSELVGRGVAVSPVGHFDNGTLVDGPDGDYNTFAFFADPDGNSWALQERKGSPES
jgi:predicted enzyme related to lactoylglutathione lyase